MTTIKISLKYLLIHLIITITYIGLQHYAALGKDAQGGKAVNLSPSPIPQDVYTKVLEIVLRDIEKDASIAIDHPDEKIRIKGNVVYTCR
jgi:DNA-directed RNA polymerase